MYIECSDDGNDCYVDDILSSGELLHLEIINKCNFWHDHIIDAQLSYDKSPKQQEISAVNNPERQDITAEGTDFSNIPHNQNKKTYSTMLKLI